MKKVKITFLLAMLTSMIGLNTSAHDIAVQNADGVTIYYNYINNNTELAITYGGKYPDDIRYYNRYTGNFIIPESVTYNNKIYSVTSIGNGAFEGCSGLTSITIPNSVTSIEHNAFRSCSGLTSVTIPNSVTSIGDYAFYNCSGLTSIDIPNSVTSIGSDAFGNCSGLQKVIAPDIAAWCGISFRGSAANPLYYAHHLYSDNNTEITELVIPDGVTGIGYYAFDGCSGLTSITIPNSVTSIGKSAFYGCSGLTSVTLNSNSIVSKNYTSSSSIKNFFGSQVKSYILGDEITSVGEYAFDGCSGLTSVTIPNSVTSIGSYAFNGCSGLTSVTIHCKKIDSGFSGLASIREITLGSEVEKLSASAFNGCKNYIVKPLSTTPPYLEGVIKDGVIETPYGASINYALAENWKETDIIYSVKDGVKYYPLPIIHDGGTIISVNGHNDGYEAVENNYTEIKLNDIHDMYAVTLGNEYITNALNKEGKYDFNVSKYHKQNLIHSICSSYLTINLQKEGTLIDEIGVDNVDNIISLKVSGNINGTDILTIRKMTNLRFLDLNDANIVDGGASYYKNYITSKDAIGDYFFKEKENLIRINLPQSITVIKNNAFDGCTNLEAITIPSKVTSVGSDVFKGCNSLVYVEIQCNNVGTWFRGFTSIKEVILSDGVTNIGGSAFEGCSKLTTVTIGNSVTSIGGNAFYGCSSLKKVIVTDIAKWCKISFGIYLYYSQYSNPLYCAHHLYSDENNEIKELTIPNSVTSIGNYAFSGCSGLTSITIPNSVTSIGYSAFEGCSGLTSVTIPNSVTDIGNSAFEGCSKLTSITIPNSVTSIERYAFRGCSKLTSVTINSNSIVSPKYTSSSSIKDIFGTQVKSYVLGDKITGIGNYAFYNCSELTSITIPNSVTNIGSYAFEGCSRLEKVIVSDIAKWCKISFEGNPLWFAHHLYSDENNEIKELTIPNGVTEINSHAFKGCSGLTSVTIPNSVTSIGSSAFEGCSGLTSVTIPNSVTNIGSYAFEGCSKLTTVTIGNSVTNIGGSAFEGCSKLTTVTIGNSVTSIGHTAFKGCSGLTSVTIPNSVTSIGYSAFEGCSKLTTVTIGNSVTSIGHTAFKGCSNLTDVVSLNTTPPEIQNNTFNTNTYSDATLKVPTGCETIYWLHPYWENFKKIEVFDPSEIDHMEIDITLSSGGYATFYNDSRNFKLPTGLSALVITSMSGNTLSYKTIASGDTNGIIPKGVPVVLTSNNKTGSTYTLTSTTESASYSGENLLHGSSLMTMTSNVNGVSTSGNSSYVYYKLAYGKSGSTNANKLGWYWGATNGAAFTIAGGKAWLALPKSSAQSLDAILLEEDDVTSINGIEQSNMNEANDAQYNMAGQRVGNGYNGIIIVNGKKVIR